MIRRRLLCVMAAAAAVLSPALAQDNGDFAPTPRTLDVHLVRPVSTRNLDVAEPIFSSVGSLPRVTVEITNRTSRERHLEYEFEWFNTAGVQRQTLRATQSVFLDPGESQTLMSVAQHADATRARVNIGDARN